MCSRTQFLQRFLIRFLIFIFIFNLVFNQLLIISSKYVLTVRLLFQKNFYTSYTHIYIHRDIPTIHLKMTEVWSKRLFFTVHSFFLSISKKATFNRETKPLKIVLKKYGIHLHCPLFIMCNSQRFTLQSSAGLQVVGKLRDLFLVVADIRYLTPLAEKLVPFSPFSNRKIIDFLPFFERTDRLRSRTR